MLTSSIANSIPCIILITIGIFAFYLRKIATKNYFLFFCLTAIFSVTADYTKSSLFVLIYFCVGSVFLVHITGKKQSILLFFITYIVACITVMIIPPLLSSILGHQIVFFANLEPLEMALYLVLSLITSLSIIFAVKYLYQRYLVLVFDNIDRRLFSFIAFSIVFSALFIYAILTIFRGSSLSTLQYTLLIVLFIMYFLLTTVSAAIILVTTQKNFENQRKIENLNTMREYTDNLEATYNNLRSFKHDYINILSTLSIFLKEKRYSEMDTYFFKNIMPLKDEFTQNNASLANLSRVNNLELKSILYTKLLQAINKNITVTVDIADEMDSLNIDTIDLSRILGIYLDNAIEAAIETPHPVVNFHLGKVNSAVVFIISNSYVNHGISISQMAQMNTTSKGSGHGLGLYNVSKILSKHDNIFAETSMNDDLFIQQLQII